MANLMYKIIVNCVSTICVKYQRNGMNCSFPVWYFYRSFHFPAITDEKRILYQGEDTQLHIGK
jgi:hypothetical protein